MLESIHPALNAAARSVVVVEIVTGTLYRFDAVVGSDPSVV